MLRCALGPVSPLSMTHSLSHSLTQTLTQPLADGAIQTATVGAVPMPLRCRWRSTAAPTPSEHGALRYARRAAAERMRSLLKRSPCVCFSPSKPFTRAALSARRLSRCRGLGLCPCRRVPVYYCVAVRDLAQQTPHRAQAVTYVDSTHPPGQVLSYFVCMLPDFGTYDHHKN